MSSGDLFQEDHELPPMEQLPPGENALANVLAFGALGITVAMAFRLMFAALLR